MIHTEEVVRQYVCGTKQELGLDFSVGVDYGAEVPLCQALHGLAGLREPVQVATFFVIECAHEDLNWKSQQAMAAGVVDMMDRLLRGGIRVNEIGTKDPKAYKNLDGIYCGEP